MASDTPITEKPFLRLDREDLWIHMAFVGLLGLAIALFRERLFADSAYYLARLIHHSGFWIEHGRVILAFSQWLPLLALKLHVPLKGILIAYSIGHILFFYLLYLWLRYREGNREAGFLLLSLQTLGILHGFFAPMFELYYGTGLLIAFWVLWQNSNRRSPLRIFGLGLLVVLILLSHPMCLPLLLFVLVFDAIQHQVRHWSLYVGILCLVALVVYFKTANVSAYQQGKSAAFMQKITSGTFTYVFRPAYLRDLGSFLLHYYVDGLVLFSFGLITMLRNRKYLLAGLTASACLGMLLLVNVSYRGFEHTRYQEQVYFPLMFLIALPVIGYVWRTYSQSRQVYLGMGLWILVVVRMGCIAQSSEAFSLRIAEMQQLLTRAEAQSNGSKFYLPAGAWNPTIMEPNWSLPIETMLLAGIDDSPRTLTIALEEDLDFQENRKSLHPHLFLFRRWEILADTTVHPRYFQLETGDYEILEVE